MKIYILADMEGISGIRKVEQVKRDSGSEYGHGCKLMMADINAAIEAAFDAGANEVVACDTHGGGGQVNVDAMDSRAVYEIPNAGLMMPALDGSFAGVVLLGHHAAAGTLNAFLDHTMSSEHWFEYRVNGRAVGEIGIEAAWAAHFGVPVIAVSGDAATAAEATALLGPVPCAIVKEGIGRNRARCVSIPEAHRRIREAVGAGVRQAGRLTPWRPALPATVELTLYRSDMADGYANRPGVERVDARTVRKRATALNDLML